MHHSERYAPWHVVRLQQYVLFNELLLFTQRKRMEFFVPRFIHSSKKQHVFEGV